MSDVGKTRGRIDRASGTLKKVGFHKLRRKVTELDTHKLDDHFRAIEQFLAGLIGALPEVAQTAHEQGLEAAKVRIAYSGAVGPNAKGVGQAMVQEAAAIPHLVDQVGGRTSMMTDALMRAASYLEQARGELQIYEGFRTRSVQDLYQAETHRDAAIENADNYPV